MVGAGRRAPGAIEPRRREHQTNPSPAGILGFLGSYGGRQTRRADRRISQEDRGDSQGPDRGRISRTT
jgi:hypothetical protein